MQRSPAPASVPRTGQLGGSSGVVVMPLLVIGILFLLAGTAAHEHLRIGHRPTATPAH